MTGYPFKLTWTLDSDDELRGLVALVIEMFGEQALGQAIARALEDVPFRPLDASLQHLVPERSRARAVSVDVDVLKLRLTDELRLLARAH